MKLNEFQRALNPGQKVEIKRNTVRLFAFIENHCSRAVAASKQTKRLLFRGLSGDTGYLRHRENIFLGNPRDDRKTRAMSDSLAIKLNKEMRLWGFEATRDNSIFCTSHRESTGTFGYPYVIFPLNGFKFTWSKHIKDLNYAIGDYTKDYSDLFYGEQMSSLIELAEFQKDNYKAALLSGNEVMIKGNYVALYYYDFDGILYEKFGVNAL